MRQLLNICLLVLPVLLSLEIQAYSKQQLIDDYRLIINEDEQSVTLPPGSSITQSSNPVVVVLHPETRDSRFLVGKAKDGVVLINVDSVDYKVNAPVKETPTTQEQSAKDLLRQETQLLRSELASQAAQLAHIKMEHEAMGQALVAEKAEKLKLEMEKQQTLDNHKAVVTEVTYFKGKLKQQEEELRQAQQKHQQHRRKEQQLQGQLRGACTGRAEAGQALAAEKAKCHQIKEELGKVRATWKKTSEELKRQEDRNKALQTRLKQQEKATHQQAAKQEQEKQKAVEQEKLEAKNREKALRKAREEDKKNLDQQSNTNKQLSAQNQRLTQELAQLKKPKATEDKSTQTEDLHETSPETEVSLSDESLPLVDGAELQQIEQQEVGQTPDRTITEVVEPTKKKKKNKTRKKKGKRAQDDLQNGGEVTEPVIELPYEYRKINQEMAGSFSEVTARDRRQRVRGAVSRARQIHQTVVPVHNRQHIKAWLGALLSAPEEDYLFGSKSAEQLYELLHDNLDRMKQRGSLQGLKETFNAMFQLLSQYRTLFDAISPLDALDLAFQSDQHVPQPITHDLVALAVVEVLPGQWAAFSPVLKQLLPDEELQSDIQLHAALEGLLYGLMAQDIDLIEKMLGLLSGPNFQAIFIVCCNSTETATTFDDEVAEYARKSYRMIVYIKRMMDHLLVGVSQKKIWSEIEVARLLEMESKTQKLLQLASGYEHEFIENDIRYGQRMDEKKPGSRLYRDELKSMVSWQQAFAGGHANADEELTQEAFVGFVTQLECMLDPATITDTSILDPEGRLQQLGLTPVRSGHTKPCLLDIARRARGLGETLPIFLQRLLQLIVSSWRDNGGFYKVLQGINWSGEIQDERAFIQTLIEQAKEQGLGCSGKKWGGSLLYYIMATYIKRPILLVITQGSTGDGHTMAILFKPGAVPVGCSSIDAIQSVVLETENLLIIGFATPYTLCATASPEPQGVWFEMTTHGTTDVINSEPVVITGNPEQSEADDNVSVDQQQGEGQPNVHVLPSVDQPPPGAGIPEIIGVPASR